MKADAWIAVLRRISPLAIAKGVLVCVPVATLLSLLISAIVTWPYFIDNPMRIADIGVTFAVLWLIVYVIFGVPAHVALALVGLCRATHYLLAGAIIGALIQYVWFSIFWDVPRAEIDKSALSVAFHFAVFSMYGSGAAFIFWFAVVRGAVKEQPSNYAFKRTAGTGHDVS